MRPEPTPEAPRAREFGPKHRKASVVSIDGSARMVWRGPEYPVLTPGIYQVRGTTVQGPVWLRSYQRWSVRIECAFVAEPGSVSMFFNLGSDKRAPHIGRQSRYYRAWVLANGEHPRKGQEMDADVFCEGQFFDVQVESCNRDENGEPKSDAEVYSRITKIVSAHRS